MYIKLVSYRIAKALSSCNATTGDIISTTERLKQELEVTTQRQEIVSYFLRDYQLSSEEVLYLLSFLNSKYSWKVVSLIFLSFESYD